MKTIKFKSNNDLMRGLRVLIGKFPMLLVDGTTYTLTYDAVLLLKKHSINFDYVNGGTNAQFLMLKLKEAILDA